MSKHVELRYLVWDDQLGCRIEIGDDKDGLDLIEIVAVEKNGKRCNDVYIREEDAEAIASAIIEVAKHIRLRNKTINS